MMIPGTNYAIVVGINDYQIPQGSLKGAVNDAVRMWQWLTDSKGGNVPRGRILLFLSSTPLNPPPQFPRSFYPATKSAFIEMVEREFKWRKEQGDRLYFYFSGHGIADQRTLTLEQTLLMQDFTRNASESSFRVKDMLDFFQATDFSDQIFFIDACNNLPPDWKPQELVVGQWTRPLHVQAGHVVQQFAIAATSPGGVTIELAGKGVFTDVLLEGLQGKGKAKAYDPRRRDYVVKVGRLFTYIEEEVPKRVALAQEAASQLPVRGGIQQIVASPALPYIPQPEIRGRVPGRTPDPEFMRMPTDLVSQEQLTIHVEPVSVVPGVEIHVWREGQVVGEPKNILDVQDLPVKWSLPPREYLVAGTAPQHELLNELEVDLYEPCQKALQFSSPHKEGDQAE